MQFASLDNNGDTNSKYRGVPSMAGVALKKINYSSVGATIALGFSRLINRPSL